MGVQRMQIDLDTWLPVAERLKVGQRIRAPHTCGAGTPLIVSNDPERYSAWCFRCNAGGYRGKTHVRYEPVERPVERSAGGATLPHDLVPWDALEGRLGRLTGWLHSKGMHISMFPEGALAWSERQRRLVLRVNANLSLGRYIKMHQSDPDMQKWMLYGYRETPALPALNPALIREPVIVEDLLSAFKVRWATGRPCIALLGTRINDDTWRHLPEGSRPLVWLDGDPAGQKGLRDALRALRWAGYTPVPVQTVLDPKEHSGLEIRDIISKSIGGFCDGYRYSEGTGDS